MNLMIKSNTLYDRLKWVAQIGLPGAGALYVALANIWHLPHAADVVGTVTAVDAFLGVFLKKSSDNYNKSDERFDGAIHVDGEGHAAMSSEDIGEAIAAGKKEVTLKVTKVRTPEKKAPAKKAPRKRTSQKQVLDDPQM